MSKKKIISCFIGAVVIGGAALFAGLTSAAPNDGKFHLDYIKKDVTAPLGTKDNVFTVVEIVPNEAFGDFGYLIPGCEPIDMNKLAVSEDITDYTNLFVEGPNGELADEKIKTQRRFTDALMPTDLVDQYDTENELLLADGLKDAIDAAPIEITARNYGIWKFKTDGAYSEYGYYLRVEDGTGEFVMTEAADGKKTFSPTELNDGNYAWFGNGYYTLEKDSLGNHIYTPFHDAEPEPEGRPVDFGATEAVGDKFWTIRADRISYEYKERDLVNNDVFIQQVFPGSSTANGFQSQVLVVTPTQLNNMPLDEMKDLLGTAELFEIHLGKTTGIDKLWENFNKDNKVLTAEEKSHVDFKENDINWEVTWTIVERMASERPAAMMIEGANVYASNQATYYDSNFNKLFIMLMQYGAKPFYNQFADKITTTTSVHKDVMTGEFLTTGYYKDYYQGYIAMHKSPVEWDDKTFYVEGKEDEMASYMHEPTIDVGSYTETFGTILSYSGDQSLLMQLMSKKGFISNPHGATNSDAFEYFWGKDGPGSHQDGLDGVDFFEYILHGFYAGTGEKTHLNILEVQPCNTFIYKDNPNWKLYYMKLLPWFKGTGTDIEKDITVTTMPTWEYIGSIEDMNETYDLVIFGGNQNGINGGTGHNDSRLGSLLYTGVGDLVGTGATPAAQTTRYSGNDITERKFLELKSYLAGSQAIVADGSLFNGTASVNTNKIDKSSIFYKFSELAVNQNLENGLGKNIFITTANRENEMKKYVAYETCDLEFYTEDGEDGCPPEYTYMEASDGTILPNSVSSVQNGKITYRFRIIGSDEMNYAVKLYIDRSSDGVYGGSLIEDVVGNTFTGEGMNLTIYQNGNVVPNGSLKAGGWYMAECKLPASYAGVLPWKLEASCTGNPNIRDSVIAYSNVRNRSIPQVEIKVLEMALTPNMSDAEDWYENDVLYMATNGKHTNEQLQKYLDCVDGYDVTIDFLENTEWLEMFINNPDYATREEKIAAWKEYLDDYDMLSIGYCDGLTFSQNDIYKEGFDYFKMLGKGILISHDMVQTADKDYSSAWLRGIAGQQRYTTNTGKVNGTAISIPYEAADNSFMLFCNRDPRWGLNLNLTVDPARSERELNDEAITQWLANKTDASYLNLVNEGQITNYPYKINSLIEINPTHVQMNQLDMEKEGMSVWASMTDRYTKEYAGYLPKEMESEPYHGTGTGLYSTRESDVRNSYYLYNAGNITYTGVGHTGGTLTIDEMKLYVNTLIAAYRPSPDKPYVEVTNEDKVESAVETSFYIPFDGEEILSTSDSAEVFRVHFTVVDTSMLENRSYRLNFSDAAGEPLAVQRKLYTDKGIEVQKTAEGYIVEKGGNYYYDVPYELIRQGKNIDYLNLKSEYLNPSNMVVKTTGTLMVSEMKTPLFNLR